MSKKKHIATYAVLGVTGNRVGTGYLYSPEEIQKARDQYAKYEYPFHMRWRNDECRSLASPSQDRGTA